MWPSWPSHTLRESDWRASPLDRWTAHSDHSHDTCRTSETRLLCYNWCIDTSFRIINLGCSEMMGAMYKMSTPCWAVINNCHWFWNIAFFLLVTNHRTIFHWLLWEFAHLYQECRGEWFPIVIIASIKIMTIIEWHNIHDHHQSPPLYKLYNLSINRHEAQWLTWHPELVSACSPSPLPRQSPGGEAELLVTDIIIVWWMWSSETVFFKSVVNNNLFGHKFTSPKSYYCYMLWYARW